jgi:alpha/beta superfamily hydrolase
MGATMANAWIAAHPRIDAWFPVGMLVPYAARPRLPVLDVVAEHDYPEVLRRVPRPLTLQRDGCSDAVTISGTDHFMAGAVQRLLERVESFLDSAFAGKCRAP